ncbi:MAG: alanine--tRNA ligase [Akkermansia sp.]|nr:alanine--tRNA ligase [Akkermansia sp.]
MMTAAQIRQSFLDFFQSKQHTIVPSASLMPQSPGLLFTNAGMNQFVPYFLGELAAPYKPGRASDTQKCIRAGGKHNDLEDVGQDSYHHTFFEMLGNWSFGDYFKKEAISWAWELIVERWGFPVERLYATVYCPDKAAGNPGEFDQEAYDAWAALFESKGMDPKVHVVNGNMHDNFWMMGETGPCGPCSELHVDLTPEGDTQGKLVNKDSDKCIEIWNLVFMQYNAETDGTFRNLPACHVDTGMGFERACAMIQCTNGFTDFTSRRVSNYSTDVFRPIFNKIEQISGRKYVDIYPADATAEQRDILRESIAFRVIADHIRTLSFSIADGILPGNGGRNYVLRRILRRAVRYGRTLGLEKPFLSDIVDTLVAEMGGVFPELEARRDTIKETLLREETSFNETLDRGLELFDKEVAAAGKVSGDFAFKLYDTYGFPIDLTALMARERGLEIDTARFDELMEEQRQRAKAAQKKQVVRALDIKTDCVTEFTGYTEQCCEARVTEVHENDGVLFVITDKTPFYAEMGGQVSDGGTLTLAGSEAEVIGVQQIGKARAHLISAADGIAPAVGDTVTLTLDATRRAALQAHHSATHLLHKALRELVSEDIAQQGSLVEVDRLRFDFNSGAISKADLRRVEERVNKWVSDNLPVVCKEYPMAEIKQHKEVCQFFGDKYGDVVRLVQMGGESGKFDGVSMELCGGTHVTATAQVGVCKIMSEGAIASGVRRIEAACGAAAFNYAANVVAAHKQETEDFLAKLHAANEKLIALGQDIVPVPADGKQDEAVQKAANYEDLTAAMDAYAAYCESVKEAALEADKRMKKAAAAAAAGQADAALEDALAGGAVDGNGVMYFQGGNELLTELLNGLRKRHFPAAVFFVVGNEDSLLLGAYCGEKALAAGLKAGELMRKIAPLAGGKGGGKDDMARGSGKPDADVDELLGKAYEAMEQH